MLTLILTLLSLGSIPEFAYANPRLPTEWFACEDTSECVDIRYTCAGAAVNKRYFKEADDYFRMENSRTDCAMAPVAPLGIGFKNKRKVVCKNKKCVREVRSIKDLH